MTFVEKEKETLYFLFVLYNSRFYLHPYLTYAFIVFLEQTMKNIIVEGHNTDLYDHDQLPTSNDVRTETNLIKNESKKIPLNTTAIVT